MGARFQNRSEAGRLLAGKLVHLCGTPGLLVLALPRGGVPVAVEIARRIAAPLDVFVVRKLGVPGHEELAMGAIASGGVRVLNRPVIESLGLNEQVIEAATVREARELQRRESAYRDQRPRPDLRDRTVILVDDGIATGSTMYAAIAAVRAQGVARVIVAAPTVAHDTWSEMRRTVDELVAVLVERDFRGVGQWYVDFAQTTDEEVRELLRMA